MDHSSSLTQQKSRKTKTIVFITCSLLILLIFQAACGPTAEELSAFQTVTALAAVTPTPTASPTPAGIMPDQDLAAIIGAAADGETIHLAAGTFNLAQGVTIDKSLTLIGAGSSQTIITAALPSPDIKAVVNFSGSGTLSLEAITLEYIGDSPAAVIYADSGALGLDDCILTGATVSDSGSQLGAIQLNDTAIALIRNSQINGSVDRLDPKDPDKIPGGIFASGNTQLTLENVMITDSYLGVYAYGDAVVSITNSTFSNTYAALGLLDNATCTLTGNTIDQSKTVQIALFDNARLTASENTLNNLDGSIGFQINETAYAHLEKNKINNGVSGILFSDNSTGEAVANEVSMVTNVGIYIQKDASVVVDSNILDSCYISIDFDGNSTGSIVNNNIMNGEIGISIASPANPSVVGNNVQGWTQALTTDPEEWLNSLDARDNYLTDGPPEIIVITNTPTN